MKRLIYYRISDSTDYVGNLILKNGKPQMYLFDGGYYSFDGDKKPECHYYIADYQGNNRMVINARTNEVEQTTHYYPYGGIIGNLSSNQEAQKYKYSNKELDRTYGLDLYDFQARLFNPALPVFDRPDPLAEKYYSISPYAYCAGDPVNCVDPDGRDPRLYIETNGFGHAFITTGHGSSTSVYTFGRYQGGDKHKSSCSRTDPTGAGVLVKLQGKDAERYIKEELNDKGASVFQFSSGSDEKIDRFLNSKLDKGEDSFMKNYQEADAKVIGKYNILNNNCVTNALEALDAGGVDVSSICSDISPDGLKLDMQIQIAKDIINKWANGEGRKIVIISPEKIIKEYEE